MDYFESRSKAIREYKAFGALDPYPHKVLVSIGVPEFVKKFSGLEAGEMLEQNVVSISGRVTHKRISGVSLVFYSLVDCGAGVQVMAQEQHYHGDWKEDNERIRIGDVIGVCGFPGKSKRGEISVIPRTLKLLSPCLWQLPKLYYGVKDPEIRYRQRYLDLMMNKEVMERFLNRSRVIRFIRDYLHGLGYVEVETPMMDLIPSGAAARPFCTHHNELNMELFLRIAPELYLKKLVVGGLNRVFEIGRVFRNEGIDATHNPEFTMCEFYTAYSDRDDIMAIVEDLISKLVFDITGGYSVKYKTISGNEVEIDFKPPFKRVSFIGGLEEKLGVKFPENIDFETLEYEAFLIGLCLKHNIECPEPRTTPRLLDRLASDFLDPQFQNPTFLIDHPIITSPLAKNSKIDGRLAERFELFIAHKEVSNAYTELNDPVEQKKRFEQQMKFKERGDDEVPPTDADFITALEYGLPPTAGCGIGIDRLVMLLTNTTTIREVILFPTMRPEK